MDIKELIELIEEQSIVKFTGKINALDVKNKQLLGEIFMFEGDIINTKYRTFQGLKAFYDLILTDGIEGRLKFIMEPEVVDPQDKKIHYPLSILKNKLGALYQKVLDSRGRRPPMGLKILINPAFIEMGDQIVEQEYSLLCTLSDYNKVEEVYNHSDLLEFEITNALVSLREKHALKVIKAG